MKFKLFSFTLAASLFSYIFSDDTCYAYKCVNNTLLNINCMKKENQTFVDVQNCDDNYHCKYDITTFDGNCEKIDYTPKQFIAGPCNVKSDCVASASDCVKNVCTADPAAVCKDDIDCSIGSFCDKSGTKPVCSAQIAVGSKCTADSQCVNEAGCLKGNCTKYFSLADGVDVEKYENRFLCQSAFVIENKCATADLVSEKLCTTSKTCKYAFANKTEINSTSSCVCGKNEVGNSYCRLGVNSEEFKKDLEIQKKFFNNTSCHTTERLVPCAASANGTEAVGFEYKKNIKNMHNTIIKNNVAFTNVSVDSCILPVVGGYDNNIVAPVSTLACPKYTCGSEASCAKSFNPNNWNSSDILVTLSKGVCLKNQTCAINNIQDVYSKQQVSFNCENGYKLASKEAGEKCSSNDDCMNKNCTSTGVCKFIALGEECDNDDFSKHCGIGGFCVKQSVNGTDKNVCAAQKGKDQNCTSTFECENNLMCYNSTCSIEFGTKDDTFEFDPKLTTLEKSYFQTICKSFVFSFTKNRCTTYKYHVNHTVNSDGYVACEPTKDKNECSYTDSFNNNITKACDCGFNAKGNSYCPIDFGKRNV